MQFGEGANRKIINYSFSPVFSEYNGSTARSPGMFQFIRKNKIRLLLGEYQSDRIIMIV